jgi:hypothetical protein
MIRGCRKGSRRSAREGGTTPLVALALEGSNPQGEEQVLRMSRLLRNMCWV